MALALAGVGMTPAQAKTADTGTVKITVKAGDQVLASADVSLSATDVDWENAYAKGLKTGASGETDNKGVFPSPELAPGTYEARVSYWAGAFVSTTQSVTVTANKDDAKTITLEGIQAIKGKVTANGKPVASGSVSLSGTQSAWGEIENGSYLFWVTPGTYTVEVSPEWGKARTWLTTYSGNTVRFPDAKKIKVSKSKSVTVDIKAYDKIGKITGTVTDAKGKPAKGVNVYANALNRAGNASAVTDSKGKYTLAGLPADKYSVNAYVDAGYQWVSMTTTVKTKATAKVNLKLPKVTKHKGKIVVTLKAPKALVKAGQACAVAFNSKGLWSGSDCLRSDGKSKTLTIEGLAAGKYKVALTGANTSKTVTVKKNKTTKVKMTRVAGTTLSGKVSKPSGNALASAYVTVTDENGTSLYSQPTDAKGKYKISGVVKGKYTVSARASNSKDGVAVTKKLTLKGKKATANLKLIKPSTITGTVVNSKGKAVEGIDVSVGWGWGETGAKGTYKIEGLAAGTYTAEARDPYYGGYFDGKSSKKKVGTGKTVKFSTIKVKS